MITWIGTKPSHKYDYYKLQTGEFYILNCHVQIILLLILRFERLLLKDIVSKMTTRTQTQEHQKLDQVQIRVWQANYVSSKVISRSLRLFFKLCDKTKYFYKSEGLNNARLGSLLYGNIHRYIIINK